MKKIALAILSIITISNAVMANGEDVVNKNIRMIAQELEAK